MVMDSRVRALYKIEPRPEGPGQARRIIAEELSSRMPADELDDIKLMVSELVTHGIVHGGEGLPDAPLMLDLSVSAGIRCRVLDRGQRFAVRVARDEPARDEPAQGKPFGCGLRLGLVETLADRWGMQCSPHLTEVWFERGSR